jgi:sporulation protein YlmC with PRC-barrel domain
MISRDAVHTLLGGTAYGNDGAKLGSIGQVYLDNTSGEPAWVTVKTGSLGSHECFVPLDEAELTEDGIRVPYDQERVEGAPDVETDRELTGEDEDQLYAYYGLDAAGSGYDTTAGEPTRYAGYDAGTAPGSNPTLSTSDATDADADAASTSGTDETQARLRTSAITERTETEGEPGMPYHRS